MDKKAGILIVEDELATASFIATVIKNNCENMEVAGKANSVQEALVLIERTDPDIVLLDIELGDGTAFDLLKKIENPAFITIFLTAYQGYALQAIKFSAFDYILKPFKPKELISTLEKAAKVIDSRNSNQSLPVSTLLDNLTITTKQDKKMILRTGSDIFVTKIKDILYCKADSSYTHFYFVNDDSVTVSTRLKEFENTLSDMGFIRCHNSYLVNISHIKRYRKTGQPYLLLSNEETIPVSLRNKEKVSAIFKD